MITGNKVPLVNENVLMGKALKILSDKKLGILIITNKKKKTCGIITDGQIRRFAQKKINFKNRIKIAEHIKLNSHYSIGVASVEEILNLNVLQASLLSMKRAIEKLEIKPGLTLIDGNFAPKGLKNYKTIINGDEKIKVISAASIIAKVYRDRFMIGLSKKFSNYAWDRNFGYGTKAHFEGIKKFGVTSHHRKGFKPIHKILSS